MGGGSMMMRILGRSAGSAVAGAAKVPATPSSHCSVNRSAPRPISNVGRTAQAVSSSNSTVQIQEISTAAASVHEPCVPVEGVINQSNWESDNWEFTVREDYLNEERDEVISAHREEEYPQHRLVFGTVPTREEVEEAVSDLKGAVSDINSVFNASRSSNASGEGSVASEANSVSSTLEVTKRSELGDGSDIETSPSKSMHWKEPALQLPYESSLQRYGSSEVFHAFKLLQSNADVQGMVVSLASDKAVWDAVMKNEKVASFRKQLEEAESRESLPSEETDDAGSHKYWWDGLKEKIFEYMDKVKEILQEMFGLGDKKASGIPERHLLISSSVMLSVVVLLVVLIKRAS
eukprot:TRINITY_DN25177_c0_g2_i1.p1 TRINITY_DN25177_c0_g2~~TRINITY_DN25177_c0_g2_i1.p1  ORF type:complete len:395 (+),score=77.13 TRINITY_DN25177_c0_g2_i1:140-1186(+)